MQLQRIGVLGAGAWGTALAQIAATAGRSATLWARSPELAATIAGNKENGAYLPGVRLHPGVRITSDRAEAADSDAILAVIPAQHLRQGLCEFAPYFAPGQPVVLCAKGIEQRSLALMTQVLAESLPSARAAVLSGPGFAREVALGLPTATTIACADEGLGQALVSALGQPTFRPYWTSDLIGAEIGGAVKNVIAIACGIAEGRGLGAGARAALITRGFAELQRLGLSLGARAETLAGLCGLGDLVLTCTSLQSRNMALGAAIGAGQDLQAAVAGRRTVAEGAASAPAVAALAARQGVDMPICAAVDAVLDQRLGVAAAIQGLLNRPFRAEGA